MGLLYFFRIDRVASGLPELKVPPMQTTIDGRTLYFTDMIAHVGSSLLALPLISILESIAVAKAFCKCIFLASGEDNLNIIIATNFFAIAKGRTIDSTQEMLALGMCNLFGSFFQSMPVTGSFTRTAINNASGVRTTLGGIVTGCLVLLSLAFLTGSFSFIPKTTLAAVIICAMFGLVDTEDIKEIWRSKRMYPADCRATLPIIYCSLSNCSITHAGADIIPLISTLIGCLAYSIEFGILIGIAVNLTFVLYSIARPTIHVYNRKVIMR